MMAVIHVPKTPRRAFNKNRRVSKLLRCQIKHLEWAIRPASERKPGQLPKKSVKTEGEAAAHIERLTRRLQPEGTESPPADAAPAVPRTNKPRAKSWVRRGRHAR